MLDCAICLSPISQSSEAFLVPCTHFYCFSCISAWTDRQRQHPHDEHPHGTPPCVHRCPLCKAPYTYIAYDCIGGNSCRLLPMCGQPQTMSALPLSVEQSHRRAMYTTPAQLTPSQPVPVAKRPRPPHDKEAAAFVLRELQAVLLTDDVDIISQHVQGVLHAVAKKQTQQQKPVAGAAASHTTSEHSTVYGSKQDFLQQVAGSLRAFLGDQHSEQFAAQVWAFLHAGLSVAAYDRLLFGGGDKEGRGEPGDDGDNAEGLASAAGLLLGEEEDGGGGGLREL